MGPGGDLDAVKKNTFPLLLEWLYSPCGPSPLCSFLIYSIHNRQDSLNK
jgi:hypothetical protein